MINDKGFPLSRQKKIPDTSRPNCRQYVKKIHINWSKFTANITYEKWITVRIAYRQVIWRSDNVSMRITVHAQFIGISWEQVQLLYRFQILQSVYQVQLLVTCDYHTAVWLPAFCCAATIELSWLHRFPDFLGPFPPTLYRPQPNSLTFPGFKKFQQSGGNPNYSVQNIITAISYQFTTVVTIWRQWTNHIKQN